MTLRARLVRLYPRRWRERYGEEFEALLEECLHSPFDVLDIALGALDAHLGFPHEGGWRSMNRINKLRSAILLVFAGYIGFIIAGLSFYGLVDDSPAVPLMKTNLALAFTWRSVQAGAVIALIAIVIGGLPLAAVILRQAIAGRRGDLRLLLVPPAAFAALVLYGSIMLSVAVGWLSLPGVLPAVSPESFPIGNRILLGGFLLLFALAAVASAAAVWRIVSRTEAEQGTFRLLGGSTTIRLYEYAFPLSAVAALCMLFMFAATIAFGWAASIALPAWFGGHFGLLLSKTSVSYGATLSIMTLSTAMALVGMARGFRARRAMAV